MTPEFVLDASAILAWLQREPGTDGVDPLIPSGAISAVNWSEVLQKVARSKRDAAQVASLLRAYGLSVIDLTAEDAELAAALWSSAPSLSLADRCCLALAWRLGVPAVTTDRAWSELTIGVQVMTIR